MAELGLFGITTPEELGGLGTDIVAYAIVMEELARGYASVADQCGLVELSRRCCTEHGTPAQQDALPGAAARLPSAAAPTASPRPRPAPTSRASARPRRATAPAGGSTGGKLWIHNAPVADFAVVLARTDQAAGKRGMCIFIVDADAARLRARAQGAQDGPARLAGRARSHFDDVALGPEALLGPRRAAASTS